MLKTEFPIFSWNNFFSLGIDEVDAQHKEIICLSNELANSIAFNYDEPCIKTNFEKFVDYGEFHISSEESVWRRRLPDIEILHHHISTHTKLQDALDELRSSFATKPQDVILRQTLFFLTQWLVNHILDEDRYIAGFVIAVEGGASFHKAEQIAKEAISGEHQNILGLIYSHYEALVEVILHLRRNAVRLHDVMDYARIGHWDFPCDGGEVSWSNEMYELFGLTHDSKAGPDTLCSIMNDDYHAKFFDSLKLSFKSGREHHVEYPIVRPIDGETRWIECRGRLIYKDDGEPEKLSGFVQDITQHKETERRIEKLALFDTLTALPNRHNLLARLEQAIIACERKRHTSALLFLDVDHFKVLNDTHGHNYGDQLLIETAKRIQKCLRQEDTLARIGGDEFVIILEGLSNDLMQAGVQAEVITQKIISSQVPEYSLDDVIHKSSISAGIVLFQDSSATIHVLLKQADIAMYQAKQAGRNAFRFFDPKMQEQIETQVKLEADIRNGLERNEFELFYQTQQDHLGSVTGVEALIRWHHPVKGLLHPSDFIKLAEETGLIIPMGRWVIEKACSQLSKWQDNPQTNKLNISINVSPKQLRQSDFVSHIIETCSHYEIDPKHLKIELTESQLLDDLDRTSTQIEELGNIGLQFSLDDFGTGYSSLQHLKQLPIFQLKIDQSFVHDILFDNSDQSIVRTIISMAKGLGLDVIAEGVETAQQQQYLLNEGCENYQGYLFSKPMPIDLLKI